MHAYRDLDYTYAHEDIDLHPRVSLSLSSSTQSRKGQVTPSRARRRPAGPVGLFAKTDEASVVTTP